MFNNRLSADNVNDVMHLVGSSDCPYSLSERLAGMYCNGAEPSTPSMHAYGLYDESGNLTSLLTAAFTHMGPDENVVQIARLYTKPECRGNGNIQKLLKCVVSDARDFFHADYVFYDGHLDSMFAKDKAGFDAQHKDSWKYLLNGN